MKQYLISIDPPSKGPMPSLIVIISSSSLVSSLSITHTENGHIIAILGLGLEFLQPKLESAGYVLRYKRIGILKDRTRCTYGIFLVSLQFVAGQIHTWCAY